MLVSLICVLLSYSPCKCPGCVHMALLSPHSSRKNLFLIDRTYCICEAHIVGVTSPCVFCCYVAYCASCCRHLFDHEIKLTKTYFSRSKLCCCQPHAASATVQCLAQKLQRSVVCCLFGTFRSFGL